MLHDSHVDWPAPPLRLILDPLLGDTLTLFASLLHARLRGPLWQVPDSGDTVPRNVTSSIMFPAE